MGILEGMLELIDVGLEKVGRKDLVGLKMCELGDQIIKNPNRMIAKNYFISKGVSEHTSIDMNGKHGALRLDLSKPIDNSKEGDKWYQYFDIVTNYGTAEHVQDGIYECYQNIHNFTKVGGIMINAGPPTKGCPWHSPYHYDADFFEKLAAINSYDCLYNKTLVMPRGRFRNCADIDKSIVCAVFIKKQDSPFCTKEAFLGLNGIEGLKQG